MNEQNPHPTMVSVGHLCVDTLGILEYYPKENTSRRISEVDRQAGGGASQASVAFSRLGGKAGYIGYIGDDANGDFLYSGLVQEEIDVSCVQRKPGISNFSFVCVSAETATRTLFNYHQKLPPINFDSTIAKYMAKSNYLHIDSTMYINALAAANLAHELGLTVSLDASSMLKDNLKNIELAKTADIFISNEEYPCKLMEDENKERALKQIAKWNQKIVMMTLGEKGSMAVVNGEIVYFPAYHVETIDTTGAGDVFHGAFIRGLELGYNLYETVRFASAVSAINCLTLGGRAGIPNLSSTLKFIEDNKY